MRSRWRMSSLLEVALLLLSISHRVASKELLAPVGKLLEVAVPDGNFSDQALFPSWLRYNKTSATLFGIPQLSDLGTQSVFLDNGDEISVEVVEETENPCGEQVTNWMEFHYPNNVTDESQEALRDLLYALADVVDETGVAELRVFPRSYLSRYRSGRYSLEDPSLLGGPDKMVITYRLNCGELDDDQVGEIIERMPANYTGAFHVMAGRVIPAHRREKVVPADRRETRRTTREAWRTTPGWGSTVNANLPPQKMNSLKTVKCKLGILCVYAIPVNTFFDAEDGDTTKLALSTHAIGNHSNFLHVFSGPQARLEGVALESGTFSFRLDARDRTNQASSAAFSVEVEEAAKAPNHEYKLALYTKAEELGKPELMVQFVRRLAGALSDISKPDNVRVHDISADTDRGAVVTWSNRQLYKTCYLSKINKTFEAMHFGAKDIQKIFREKMGANLNPKHVSLKLLGNCESPTASVPPGRRNESASDATVVAEPTSSAPIAMIVPLVLLFVLLLLLVLIIYCCCAQRKRALKKKKTSDYVSKGLPVVFPEEVPHEEENVTVSTPMLVSHEHPPFDPKMTLHENPLYKPPSAPPQSFQSSPSPQRAITATVGQRKPPPYIVP